MLYVLLELGAGAQMVIDAATRERQYRLACITALRAGDEMPPPTVGLSTLVASYVRYWALQVYSKPDPVASGDIPVYHVPPKGWALLRNGVSFVVSSRDLSGPTRAAATFAVEPSGNIDTSAMLVVSRQTKGWLATFREQEAGA